MQARLTATERVGVHSYTFPSDADVQRIVIDLLHGIYNYDGKTLWAAIRVESDTLITGYRITNGWARENYTYFAASFSKPVKNYGYREKEPVQYRGFWRKFDLYRNFPEMAGRGIVSYFEFDPADGEELVVKVALSAVGTEGALRNLAAEAEGEDFGTIAAQAREKWNRELSAIEVSGTHEQKTMLYTSLYHTMINPSVYMDVDGSYRGIDHNIHHAEDFKNYTVFSVWDTYRALHPLFNIINRSRSRDIAASMLAHQGQSVHGALPVWSHMGNENWCMIGYHSVSVIADALDKGLISDRQRALAAMVASSNVDYYDGTGEYKRLGYVPFDRNANGSSITLEYAYDDWTVYRTAAAMGEDKIAEEYGQRAMNYRNVFDPSLGFVRARMSDGSWKEPFSLLGTHGEGFIEGNSWNYSFYVPHDVRGMIELMGGDGQFVERLDSLFTMHLPDEFFEHTEDVTREGIMGNYVHGNEPSHHVAYLYAWTSQPWKTQYWVREIMNRMYRNSIDGLCGNDDCGQMSAWYLFMAMGFYPVCPGSEQYVLGAPYLPYLRVRVGDEKYLEIKAPKVSDRMRYVKSVTLNGRRHEAAYITYDEIKDGGELVFEMTSKPSAARTFTESQRPYSLSN